jgi:hypothetical protein
MGENKIASFGLIVAGEAECGAKQLLTGSVVRAAPFALVRNPTAAI